MRKSTVVNTRLRNEDLAMLDEIERRLGIATAAVGAPRPSRCAVVREAILRGCEAIANKLPPELVTV